VTNRVLLWAAFVFVHLFVGSMGFLLPNQPTGDVWLVYEPWSRAVFSGGGIVGVTHDWVYPHLALVPMLLAHVPGALVGDYTVGWAILVVIVDAVAFAVLVGRGRSRGRVTAAVFWLAAILCLGPVGMYRIDGISVPLAILGCLWLLRRPWLASVLLAAATWIKIWPAALLAAALVAVRRRSVVVAAAALVSALIFGVVVALGGADHALGFVSGQTGRGLQVEAPVSAVYLWGALFGVEGSSVYYDQGILTFQVMGAHTDVVAALMTPLLVLAVGAVVALGAVQARRGVSFLRLFPTLGLTLTTVLIVVNKVGSPQFQAWLFAVVVLGLVVDRRRWVGPGILVLVSAALTQLVYPVLYNGIVSPTLVPVAVLTLRNVALIVLLVWMAVRLVRLPAPAPALVRSTP